MEVRQEKADLDLGDPPPTSEAWTVQLENPCFTFTEHSFDFPSGPISPEPGDALHPRQGVLFRLEASGLGRQKDLRSCSLWWLSQTQTPSPHV